MIAICLIQTVVGFVILIEKRNQLKVQDDRYAIKHEIFCMIT